MNKKPVLILHCNARCFMKKFISAVFAVLLSCILPVALIGCSDNISSVTDIERFSDMQKQTDKIDVDFDNATGEGFKFSITDAQEIEAIMDIIFSDTLSDLGKQPCPPGSNSSITIYQGEKSYCLSTLYIAVNGNLYTFSTRDLSDKIYNLAAAQGAFDYRSDR